MNIREVAQLTGYSAVATTTSANGGNVDLQPYLDVSNIGISATLYCVNVIGTQGGLAVKVQESDTTTSGDFTDISGATFTALTTSTANNDTLETIYFHTNKRYVRLATTASGTSPSYTVAGTFNVFNRLV